VPSRLHQRMHDCSCQLHMRQLAAAHVPLLAAAWSGSAVQTTTPAGLACCQLAVATWKSTKHHTAQAETAVSLQAVELCCRVNPWSGSAD
jgi:hypothetical protein